MKNIYSFSALIAVVIAPILAQNSINDQDILRNETPNVLQVNVTGGDLDFGDNLYIYFCEEATPGYDNELESIKWLALS